MFNRAYRVILTLHDDLIFATREIGRVVETGQYLHNYALTYAFHFAKSPIRLKGKEASIAVPRMVEKYKEDLAQIKEIYITPAKPLKISYSLVSYSTRSEFIRTVKKPYTENIPDFGTWKVIAPLSSFECFFLLKTPLVKKFPIYIRLGKTLAKIKVNYEKCDFKICKVKALSINFPLNPLDLPLGPQNYEMERMRPWPLYTRSTFNVKEAIRIITENGKVRMFPRGLHYYAGEEI